MGFKTKSVAIVLVTLFLLPLIALQPVNSQGQSPQITISTDGSVVGTNTIIQNGNTYTLTNNLTVPIVIEKDNIVLDGAGFTIQGSGSYYMSNFLPPENTNTTAISVDKLENITIRDMRITNFGTGIAINGSRNCLVTNNTLYNRR